MRKIIITTILGCLLLPLALFARQEEPHGAVDSLPVTGKTSRNSHRELIKKHVKTQYGVASFYSNKFEGRKTYTDEIFSQDKLSAASNTLPMHTWVRVTNLHNHRSVILKINDKMHPRNRRLIDLSRAAARKLGITGGRGLARVRIDVLGKKKPAGTAN